MEMLWIVLHRSVNMTHATLDILLYFFPSINQWGVAAGTAKVWQWKVALSPTVTFVSPDTMVNTGFAEKNQIPSIMITPRHDDIFYVTNPIHGGPMIISRSPERATNAERCCFLYVGLDNLLKKYTCSVISDAMSLMSDYRHVLYMDVCWIIWANPPLYLRTQRSRLTFKLCLTVLHFPKFTISNPFSEWRTNTFISLWEMLKCDIWIVKNLFSNHWPISIYLF